MKIESRTPPPDRAAGGNRCDRESAEALDPRYHEVVVRRFPLGDFGRPRPERFRRAPAFPEPRRRFGSTPTPLPETGTARRRADFAASFPTFFPPTAEAEEGAREGEGVAR